MNNADNPRFCSIKNGICTSLNCLAKPGPDEPCIVDINALFPNALISTASPTNGVQAFEDYLAEAKKIGKVYDIPTATITRSAKKIYSARRYVASKVN